ncbi:DapH/DapD/GlmU-related protein [Haloarcula sp. Atlit-47R]|uniref:acyltransferase n=1 Tax=Haloarcula sp. Atlit-47R TaxID=2282132 RepID=UPI0031837BE9
MNSHGRILCGNEITIGDGCELSWDVQLLDDDRHKLSINGTEQPRSGPIHIGDNVWIGQGVTVLKGVSIGDGSVIGASSVVSKDIPPQSLAVGQPANVVREDVAWS